MLEAGDMVPLFTCKDQNGNEFDFRDHKNEKMVLFFFPKSMTPTCTVQACNLRDNYNELKKHGFIIVGISPDSGPTQKKFQTTHQLPFTLLSDPDHSVMNKFGVWGEKQLYGRKFLGVHRTTFIIKKGKVIHVFRRPRNRQHAEEILSVIDNTIIQL